MSLQCSLSETRLIEECMKGNRKSQQELYARFSSKMFSVCLRYSKNHMDAEDILQEGFIKLFKHLDKYRGEGSFDGWVRRIFVNTAIEHIRRKSMSTVVSEGLENSLKDRYLTPLDNLFEKDLIRSTDNLSDGYKTVFNLYAVKGFSHKEIAHHLGITESTSKSQFSRAKALLRTFLTASAGKRADISI